MTLQLIQYYKHNRRRKHYFLVILGILLLLTLFSAFFSGGAMLSVGDFIELLHSYSNAMSAEIFLNIRLPRIIGVMLAGGVLAVSGNVLQCVLRNQLASPYTLGISSSAAFGAALAIILFGQGLSVGKTGNVFYFDNPYIIGAFAFLFSLIGVICVLWLTRIKGGNPEIIILSGVIIGSLFSAGLTSIQYFADKVQLATLVFWTFGDLSRANWSRVLILTIVSFPIFYFFLKNRWNFKALCMGDDYAISLGINVKMLRIKSLVAAAFCSAMVVSLFGVIGFVGLVVPHILKTCIGRSEEYLIPATIIGGAFFLLLCDTLGRTLFLPVVVPVGIITSLIGVPVFLLLLLTKSNK